MPGMDRCETASLISGNKNYSDVNIIFLSSTNKDDSFVEEGYKLGGIDYIFKPDNSTILINKVNIFLDLHIKSNLFIRKKQ